MMSVSVICMNVNINMQAKIVEMIVQIHISRLLLQLAHGVLARIDTLLLALIINRASTDRRLV